MSSGSDTAAKGSRASCQRPEGRRLLGRAGGCAARETNKNIDKEGKGPSEIGGRQGASDGILPSAGSGNIRYDNSLLPATAYHCDPDRPYQMGVYPANDHCRRADVMRAAELVPVSCSRLFGWGQRQTERVARGFRVDTGRGLTTAAGSLGGTQSGGDRRIGRTRGAGSLRGARIAGQVMA